MECITDMTAPHQTDSFNGSIGSFQQVIGAQAGRRDFSYLHMRGGVCFGKRWTPVSISRDARRRGSDANLSANS